MTKNLCSMSDITNFKWQIKISLLYLEINDRITFWIHPPEWSFGISCKYYIPLITPVKFHVQ